MKSVVLELINAAVDALVAAGTLSERPNEIKIERTRDPKFGDFAANVAMVCAKQARMAPRALAELVIEQLPVSTAISKVEIAGPGFINFHLAPAAYHQVLGLVFAQGGHYGRSDIGANKSVQVEFVSANPTGPLHVGHGRGAAYGATVADLLAAVGFNVHREYYVNDAGRQMDILAASVWLRYLELCGETFTFPANGYKGDYIFDMGATLHREHGDRFRHAADVVTADLPADEPAGGDKEIYIDAVVGKAKTLLGDADYRLVFDTGLDAILGDIRQDLKEFGVEYEEWFSERSLTENGRVQQAVEKLQAADKVYEEKGALWFRSTEYGDEKDRVVVRDNGQSTYFASDIAYHMDKLARGFDRVIDVWGADHHGYVPRVKAALSAMGDDPAKLDVLLVQFAILYRGGEKAQMSTRSGEFVTLRELREEVGRDAARFFYVMRKCEQHLDFDLDLAKSQSADNPVYYIQYAHARVCSVLAQAEEQGIQWDTAAGLTTAPRLNETHEVALMVALARYPEVVEAAALAHEPHQLCHYLRDLANALHTYYNAHQFLVDDAELRNARLTLIIAARTVLDNGLGLLGVSAPERM
jgi:arginyl-tRNA synthetase